MLQLDGPGDRHFLVCLLLIFGAAMNGELKMDKEIMIFMIYVLRTWYGFVSQVTRNTPPNFIIMLRRVDFKQSLFTSVNLLAVSYFISSS